MLDFELEKENIIVTIKKDIFYYNFKIYKDSFDLNKKQEIDTAYEGNIIIKIDLNQINLNKECINALKNVKNNQSAFVFIEDVNTLYFSENNIVRINLSSEFRFYNENLKNKKIPIPIRAFIVNPRKLKQIECLLKIKKF
tara:strand:- start:12788 stop:13207 length:420 start_codon:yes stop_codon:yes gene_type:complete